ncbi:MAG: GNAT family N-acetyltransferase [Candidatus Dormiibacterota bacterium]
MATESSPPDASAAERRELLAAFDTQMRWPASIPRTEGTHEETDGPVYRRWDRGPRGFVMGRDLAPLDDRQLDALIRRQIDFFAERSVPFEWKAFSHDQTAGLTQRLLGHGFVPEEQESLVIGRLSQIDQESSPPPGVTIRGVHTRADTGRMAELLTLVDGEDRSFLGELLYREQRANPDHGVLLVAEAKGKLVATARLELAPNTQFASLWTGSTLPEWRRKGIYRSLVAYRARLAAERGYRYLQVDASEKSRPILERLGFVTVSTTTPFIWTPPA